MFKSTGKIKSGEFSRIITQARRARQRNDHARHDVLLPARRQGASAPGDGAGSGSHGEPAAGGGRGAHGAQRDPGGAPLQRGCQPAQHPERADARRPLPESSLSSPFAGLGARDERACRCKDAQTFYRRFYAPNNAVLVVAGDVTPEEVRPLAQATYGRNKPNPAITRARPRARSHRPSRPAVFTSKTREPARRCCFATIERPAIFSGRPGQAESLELLSWIVGNDDTSRLYRRLVAGNLASTAGTNYRRQRPRRRSHGVRRHSRCRVSRSKRWRRSSTQSSRMCARMA